MTAPAEVAPVCVVLLNYNGGETVLRCLRSLGRQSVLPAQLLFIDNGSVDFDERAVTNALGPRLARVLRVERLPENLGYVRGMNHGLRLALDGSAPWIMTLSNDTEFDPGFFSHLAGALAGVESDAASEAVGMIAPKVRSLTERDRLDGAGLTVSLDGMSTARGQRELDQGQYDRAPSTLCPNGVAAVYRAELLREVGLLDEDFWAYCEDTDLGLRSWFAGWDCRFVPECVVFHARSSTLGEHSLRKLYLVERNHYWVALKNLPLPLLLLNPAFSSYRYLVQLYALLTGRGQGRGFSDGHASLALLKTTLEAVVDAGRGAPRALRKRVASQRLRRRGLYAQFKLLWGERLPFADLILK